MRVADKLSEQGIAPAREASRRGGHLWFFFREPVKGGMARRFGLGILEKHGISGVEVFPKQDRLTTGPGSLVRMPFGVHRKDGRRYGFVKPDGTALAPTVYEQLVELAGTPKVPDEFVGYYAATLPEVKHERASKRDTVWNRIKGAAPAMEFIGRYVELTPTGSGAVGYCPFHEDEVKSFGVNKEGNFWHCFAGCGGGSIIDFWMRYRGLDFKSATEELAVFLGVEKRRRK